MRKIGITGSIGSGKSTVARIFGQLGVPVYNADERARELMLHHPALIEGIKALFGPEAYQADGSLNRVHIATRAFNDKGVITRLNGLVHPAVFKDFDDWCAAQQAPYILKEAALMFESDSHKQLDEVIVVTAPEELRINRTMQRDKLSREDVLKRMNNQMSQEQKQALGDYEIVNDEVQLIMPQVLALHAQFGS